MALITKTATALLMGCVLICCSESNAQDHDAEGVFHRCVHRLNELNERVTNAQTQTVHQCVPRIRRLLAAGAIVEARHTARHCHKSLDYLTESGISNIRQTCRKCVEVLRRLEAPELARRLVHICEDHAKQLLRQNRRAKNVISELFDSKD